MNILGVKINLENYDSAIKKITEQIESRTKPGYVVLTNVYNIANFVLV